MAACVRKRRECDGKAPAGDVAAVDRDKPNISQSGRPRETNELEPRMASPDKDILPIAIVREVTASRRNEVIVPEPQADPLLTERVV
jgi:hypothetical protein